MAVLTGPTVLASGGGSGAPRWAVLSFQSVTAADTFDMASTTLPIAPFSRVTSALAVATGPATAAVTTTLATIATNTNVTFVGAGMANHSALLFVVGN